jgi:hypothetical protein
LTIIVTGCTASQCITPQQFEVWELSMAANDVPANAGASAESNGLLGTIREQANSRLSAQKDRAADGLAAVVEAVKQTGQQLRQKNPALSGYADGAAAQLERWSSAVRENDVSELVDRLKTFARRRPALFLGGAAALGAIAARMVKSSAVNGPAYRIPQRPSAMQDRFGSRRGSGGAQPTDIAADRVSSRPPMMRSTQIP